MTLRTRLATPTVLVPGCRWMASTMVRLPLYHAALLLSCTSSSTWTTCRTTRAPHGDRKSTRLNSSHVRISYAVFCLKKKIHHRDHVCVSRDHPCVQLP